MPVAGGDLRQQREHRVAEVAVLRDQLPRLPGEEAVRLRVVDLAAGDRRGDRLEVGRVHLVVGRHHAGDVDPLLDRALVAGDDRGADALVLRVHDDLDAWVGRGAPPCALGSRRASIVDDVERGRRIQGSRRASPQSATPRRGPARRPPRACPRALDLRGGAAADERLPEERREDPDDQADQAADRGAGAAVRPGVLTATAGERMPAFRRSARARGIAARTAGRSRAGRAAARR